MRILHVITSLRTGGAEKLLTQMLPRFRNAGIDTHLALFDGTDTPLLRQLRDEEIPVHILGNGYRSMYNPLHTLRLSHLIEEGYDIVHTHNTTPQFFTALSKRPKRTRLITTEHNTSNRRRSWPLFHHIDTWMYNQYDSIVCCSVPVEASLRQALNIAAIDKLPPILTIPNGIDLRPFTHDTDIPPENLSPAFTIVMAAAFREQKDHITPLRALALLPTDIRLIYAGDGPTKAIAEEEARRLGVADRVTFAGNVTNIPALYRNASVALLSTRHEGMSLSVIEAMASGVPLIASDVSGIKEIVERGAMLFPFGDHHTLAERIYALHNDPALSARLSARGKERASHFDIDTTVKSYINLYNTII